MSYQFIVINACNDRKSKMTELFNQLKMPSNLIHYLEASTPQNSPEYFIENEISDSHKKIICTAKSHFRALEYSSRNDSPEYSIIVEDDVAFHKTDFIKIIEEIILNSDKTFDACDYISLGWIPCNNYEHYFSKTPINYTFKSPVSTKYNFLDNFFAVGLQCYIVKKSKILDITQILNKKTFNFFRESITAFMLNKYGRITEGFSTEAVDHLLNRVFSYKILFPPIAIEQKNSLSLLNHNNENNYWNKYFKDYAELKRNYMTY